MYSYWWTHYDDLEVFMINLAAGKCVACRGGEPTLTEAEIEDLLLHVHQWQVKEVDGMKRLEKVFKFKNFLQALEFTNKVGAIAEEENHHPLIVTEWGRVTLVWWSHKIKGLHKNDFIMAAKTDEIFEDIANAGTRK
jgi:4a-hydroxytetrahydrobiopterin dehydratase